MNSGRDPPLWSVVVEQAAAGAVTVAHVCAAAAAATAADGGRCYVGDHCYLARDGVCQR
jgi:hypothetical protein